MNYLAHLLLCDNDEMEMLGSLMGDFVKGRLSHPELPPAVLRGIRQHRRVDAFAQGNRHFHQGKQLLDEDFGLFRGILIDMFFDHFLAVHWNDYHPQPLEPFTAQVYALLRKHHALLPEKFQRIAPRMIADNWLLSYREPAHIGLALERMARRFSRPTPLTRGLPALLTNYAPLRRAFQLFMAEALREFSARE